MKALWTALSLFAVLNLLAAGAGLGWLYSSGRLDAHRLREARTLFTPTTAELKLAADQAAAQAQAQADAQAAAEKAAQPPLTAAQWVERQMEHDELARQRLERLKRETEDLTRMLQRERTLLETERAALAKERADFDAMRARLAELEGNQQFRRALTTLEQLKPAASRALLNELLDDNQLEQVISYLNAMQDRTRTKVLAEFEKDAPDVAARLLEGLRTRGLELAAASAPATGTDPLAPDPGPQSDAADPPTR